MNIINKNTMDTNTNKNIYIYMYILLAFCTGILTAMFSFGLSGNDFWWHVKAGEWITNNLSVPKHDIFSWYGMSENLPWTAHEWLSEVIFHGIYRIGGQIGVFIFCLSLGMLMIYLLSTVCRKDVLKNFPYTILLFILITSIIKIYFYGRPHLFSFFLFFIELKILYNYMNRDNYKGIYFLPVLSVIWANIHGGSSNLTYILCIFFLITGLFNFTLGKLSFEKLPKKKIITLSAVALASFAGLCINPYGIHMLIYPYANMADSLMLTLISEWASPDAKNITMVIFLFLPFALGLISFIITKKQIKAIDLLIFAFFSYMFFRSSRFIILLAISMPFFVFNYIPEFGTLDEPKKSDKIVSKLLFAFAFCFFAYGIYNSTDKFKDDTMISRQLDYQFVSLIEEEQPERLYSDYNYGGDLIFYGINVYVDGRADVYTGTPLNDYFNLTTLSLYEKTKKEYNHKTFVSDILNKYNFDAFLLETNRPLYTYLITHENDYELIKEMKGTAYFKVK